MPSLHKRKHLKYKSKKFNKRSNRKNKYAKSLKNIRGGGESEVAKIKSDVKTYFGNTDEEIKQKIINDYGNINISKTIIKEIEINNINYNITIDINLSTSNITISATSPNYVSSMTGNNYIVFIHKLSI